MSRSKRSKEPGFTTAQRQAIEEAMCGRPDKLDKALRTQYALFGRMYDQSQHTASKFVHKSMMHHYKVFNKLFEQAKTLNVPFVSEFKNGQISG